MAYMLQSKQSLRRTGCALSWCSALLALVKCFYPRLWMYFFFYTKEKRYQKENLRPRLFATQCSALTQVSTTRKTLMPRKKLTLGLCFF